MQALNIFTRMSDGRPPARLRRAVIAGLIINLLLLAAVGVPLIYTCVRSFRDQMGA